MKDRSATGFMSGHTCHLVSTNIQFLSHAIFISNSLSLTFLLFFQKNHDDSQIIALVSGMMRDAYFINKKLTLEKNRCVKLRDYYEKYKEKEVEIIIKCIRLY
jgi:hypothetical protein